MQRAGIAVHKWSGAKRAIPGLRAALEAHMARNKGSALAVGGTWAGPKNLFDDPAFDGLAGFIRSVVPGEPERIDAWGVMHMPGDSLAMHDHAKAVGGGDNVLAGVFWLDNGEENDAFIYGDDMAELMQVAGALVVFDAKMMHGTKPATARRMSIAFNVPAANGAA